MRLRRIHLKRRFVERAPITEANFNSLAKLYDPMPVGAWGHPCDPELWARGFAYTFTFTYADELAPREGSILVHNHRSVH